ncbi:hypothetical protein PV326_013416 [Microctonus aethiopoides]|nr:hypothetical protein PV326_013416 [Microctonus aethiopoides]
MISLIFVACLLAGSALGQPWVNRGNFMPMQPYYNSPNAPTYALYPCESRDDPNGQWVYVGNQQHYVHVAECQQYNGQNNCAYRSANHNVHPQTQPIVYIQAAHGCQTQWCEYTCLWGSCFGGRTMDTTCQPGEPCLPPPCRAGELCLPPICPRDEPCFPPVPPRPTPPSPPETTKSPTTTTSTTTPEPTTTTTTTTTTPEPTTTTTTTTTTTPKPTTKAPTTPKPFDTTTTTLPPKNREECVTPNGCDPASQQQIYYQPSSSSSAAAAAAASSGGSSASASASAAGGSASASASASSSSQFMLYPGIPYQQNQQTPCNGPKPCEIHPEETVHVSDGKMTIDGSQGTYFNIGNQSPCENKRC